MKTITIWQPWASLVVENKKHIETRSWKTDYRGELLIHAAKKPFIDGVAIMSRETRGYLRDALDLPEVFRETDWTEYEKVLPVGVIVGKATLSNCIMITEEFSEFIRYMTPAEYAFGDFTPGRYAWVMDDPVKFHNTIPAQGKQRLWEFDLSESEVRN